MQELLKQRYLHEGEETFEDMVNRVSEFIGYGQRVMLEKKFLPNSPTLMNAGKPGKMGQLSACFVLPIEDSMDSIFETLKNTAKIHQTGGGTGFSFSRLRPEGDNVGGSRGVSSGPVSFMKIFDVATEQVKQGGMRRGANMGVLRVDHPDIEKFIKCKDTDGEISNFNISVALTDDFMQAVKFNAYYELYNPKDGSVWCKKHAPTMLKKIVKQAWKNGEPGVIFIDEMNRKHPAKAYGEIEATNPCSEMPLLPYESCNLGSINLSEHVINGEIDYNELENTIAEAVEFLNAVIEKNAYPLPQIEEMTKKIRKIGLGVMGWADALIKMGVKYDSEQALRIARKVMRYIKEKTLECSNGRNIGMLTVAPTGSISILAGCSSGIEPIFAVSEKHVHDGLEYERLHPLYEQGYDAELFRTAHDISYDWHLYHQATFQEFVDSAISKTINLPNNATKQDVMEAIVMAHKLKCKGVTVYRDNSRQKQVITQVCTTCAV